MKYVEVVAKPRSSDTVARIAEKEKALDFRLGAVGEDGMQYMRLVVGDERLQDVLDALQTVLGAQESARIMVLPLEASLPRVEDGEDEKKRAAITARETLYEEAERAARLDRDYLILVALSTVVAAIGLVENNVAVVIGAMVIAPLLGPNLALSLGTSLGDVKLVRKAIQKLGLGIGFAVALSAALGAVLPVALNSPELMVRTDAGLDSVALALASGAAAALSMTTGLPAVLVGVMVAVALLPPATTLGLMLGSGDFVLASGAGLLLAVNVVSVNLASKLVFLMKGVRPRGWLEKRQARRSTLVYIVAWLVALGVLLGAIYWRAALPT
ncbi:MAG: TIGR00341 family protein [Anaerosomatales bacterium]|nr:TIGR00341 family protein [Anaerosomatales bacterium]MDT8434582.1 TIGR00341 family protein [Anaerosomatales bacterium]